MTKKITCVCERLRMAVPEPATHSPDGCETLVDNQLTKDSAPQTFRDRFELFKEKYGVALSASNYWESLQAFFEQETSRALAEREAEYNELILAVSRKYENETRHQTALRYIKQAEQGSNESANLLPHKGEDKK